MFLSYGSEATSVHRSAIHTYWDNIETIMVIKDFPQRTDLQGF